MWLSAIRSCSMQSLSLILCFVGDVNRGDGLVGLMTSARRKDHYVESAVTHGKQKMGELMLDDEA